MTRCSTSATRSTRTYRTWDLSSSRTCSMFYDAMLSTGYRYMGYLERHDHEECSMTPGRSTRISVMGHLERHDHGRRCSTSRRVQSAPIEMGRQLGHDHGVHVLRRQRIQHHAGGLGHIQSHGFYYMFLLQTAWKARFTGGDDTPSPERVDAQGQRVRRVLSARQRRRRHLHRHPRERHVLRPRRATPGIVLEGVTSCTDRVLTEVAVCTLDVTTRAELKAAVDACVGDRLCEMTMPHWDVSRVTDMSFLFQGKSQFNVDISQWEMSQVTTAAGMFEGAASFYRDISGWTFADNANTTGMFTGADTWLAVHRARMGSTRRTVRRAHGSSTRAWRTNASRTDCARPAPAAGPEPPEMIPQLGVDTGCDVSRPCCAEGRGGQLHRRRSHRRGVLQPRRGLRRRGDGRDAGLGRVAGDEHERAVLLQERSSTRIYRDGIPRASRPCTGCSRATRSTKISVHGIPRASRTCTRCSTQRRRVQPAPIEMGRQLGHDYEVHVLRRQRIQHDAGGLGHIQSHGFYNILFCRRMVCEVHGRQRRHPPRCGWTRKDDACDASYPPVNGAVGNCTDTLMSGTSCVPTCDAGYVLEGVTSCTDRVLTEAVCTLDVTTRAELKATVDACWMRAVGARCCSSDRLCWHPDPAMSALRRRWMRGHRLIGTCRR